MAEREEIQQENAEGEEAPKSKKKLFVGGGVVGGLAVAFAAAMMAVPKKEVEKTLDGPFVAPLTAEKVQVNLTASKSYLILDLNLVYDAYDEAYFVARNEDPLANAEIKDALVGLASSKTREDISDKVSKPVFMEEIKQAVDPLIFPIHVGQGAKATDADPESGIAPGLSSHLGTFRGEFEAHLLKVDAVERTVQVDDGPLISFQGTENDLEVPTSDELHLYLDVTGVSEEFQGEVKIGVMGRVRRILWNEVLIQ